MSRLYDANGEAIPAKAEPKEVESIPHVPGEIPEGYELLPYSQKFEAGDFWRTISDQAHPWVPIPAKEYGTTARQSFEGSDAYTMFETIRRKAVIHG